MYQDILNAIDQVIENNKDDEDVNAEKFGFIQGLQVARQLVLGTEGFVRDEIPYETLEEVLMALKENLDKHEVLEIVEDVYSDK